MSSRTRLCLAIGVVAGAYWFFAGRETAKPELSREHVVAPADEVTPVNKPPSGASERSSKDTTAPSMTRTEGGPAESTDPSVTTTPASLRDELKTLVRPPNPKAQPGARLASALPFPASLKQTKACGKEAAGEWVLAGDAPKDYEVVLVDGLLGIRGVTPRSGWDVEVNRCWPAEKIAGKLVRFSMWIKAQGVSDYANIHLRAYDVNRQKVIWNEGNKGFRDTFAWKVVSFEVGVPESAAEVHVGITFESPGRAWFQDPKLQILK